MNRPVCLSKKSSEKQANVQLDGGQGNYGLTFGIPVKVYTLCMLYGDRKSYDGSYSRQFLKHSMYLTRSCLGYQVLQRQPNSRVEALLLQGLEIDPHIGPCAATLRRPTPTTQPRRVPVAMRPRCDQTIGCQRSRCAFSNS
jgi:hypothetical protein